MNIVLTSALGEFTASGEAPNSPWNKTGSIQEWLLSRTPKDKDEDKLLSTAQTKWSSWPPSASKGLRSPPAGAPPRP